MVPCFSKNFGYLIYGSPSRSSFCRTANFSVSIITCAAGRIQSFLRGTPEKETGTLPLKCTGLSLKLQNHGLLQLERTRIQLIVRTLLGNQRIVVAPLDDMSQLQNHDHI